MDDDITKLSQQINDLKDLLSKPKPQQAGIPLPIRFSGRNDPRDFESFVREYCKYGDCMDWDEKKLEKSFASFLQNEALATYDLLTDAEKASWTDLKRSMSEKLNQDSPYDVARTQLRDRFQRPHESVAEFAQAIESLIKKAYPRTKNFTDDQRQEFAVQDFIHGLKYELREHLLKQENRPSTLNEAMTRAQKMELTLKMLAEEKDRTNSKARNEALEREQSRLASELEKLKTKLSEKNAKEAKINAVLPATTDKKQTGNQSQNSPDHQNGTSYTPNNPWFSTQWPPNSWNSPPPWFSAPPAPSWNPRPRGGYNPAKPPFQGNRNPNFTPMQNSYKGPRFGVNNNQNQNSWNQNRPPGNWNQNSGNQFNRNNARNFNRNPGRGRGGYAVNNLTYVAMILGLITLTSGECIPKIPPKMADCNTELVTVGGKCQREINVRTPTRRYVSIPPEECWEVINEKAETAEAEGKNPYTYSVWTDVKVTDPTTHAQNATQTVLGKFTSHDGYEIRSRMLGSKICPISPNYCFIESWTFVWRDINPNLDPLLLNRARNAFLHDPKNWKIVCAAYNWLAGEKIKQMMSENQDCPPPIMISPVQLPSHWFTEMPTYRTQKTRITSTQPHSESEVTSSPSLLLPVLAIKDSIDSAINWLSGSAENATNHVQSWATNITDQLKSRVQNFTKEIGDGMTRPMTEAHSKVHEFFSTLWWWIKATLFTILGILGLTLISFLLLKGYALFVAIRSFWRGIQLPWRILGINVVDTDPYPRHRTSSLSSSDIEMLQFSSSRRKREPIKTPIKSNVNRKSRDRERNRSAPPMKLSNTKRRESESFSPPPRYSRNGKKPSAPIRKSWSPEPKRQIREKSPVQYLDFNFMLQYPGSPLPQWPFIVGNSSYIAYVDTFSSVSYGPLELFVNSGYSIFYTDSIEIELAGGNKFRSNKLVTSHMVPQGCEYIEVHFWALEDPTTPLVIGNDIISDLINAGIEISFNQAGEISLDYEEYLWRNNGEYQAMSKEEVWVHPNAPEIVQLYIRNPSTMRSEEFYIFTGASPEKLDINPRVIRGCIHEFQTLITNRDRKSIRITPDLKIMKGKPLKKQKSRSDLSELPSDLGNGSGNTSFSDLLQPTEWPLSPLNLMVMHTKDKQNANPPRPDPDFFEPREVELYWTDGPSSSRENTRIRNFITVPVLFMRVNGHTATTIFDTGASLSLIRASFAKRIGVIISGDRDHRAVMAGGKFPIPLLGRAKVMMELGCERIEIYVWVIRDDHIPPEFLIGFDIIRQLCRRFGKVILEKDGIRVGPSRIPYVQKLGKWKCSYLLTSHPILPIIPAAINGYPVSALFDCGASVTYCRKSVAEMAGIHFSRSPKLSAKTANKSRFEFLAKGQANITIGNYWIEHDVLISEDDSCPSQFLIGADLMRSLNGQGINISLELHQNRIRFGTDSISLIAYVNSIIPRPLHAPIEELYPVVIHSETILEPHTEMMIRCQVNTSLPDGTYLATSPPNVEEPILIGRTLVKPNFIRSVPILVLNLTSKPITLPPGKLIAQLEIIDNPDDVRGDPITNNSSPTYWVNSCAQDSGSELFDQLDLSRTILSPKAQSELTKLIAQYSEIFGEESDYRGSVTHRIDLIPGTGQIASRMYRAPMTVKEEMQKQIEKMLKSGTIEPSTSAFASPVVMVPKKSGELRFAIDYRRLNSATIKQVYHIPLISEIRDEVAGKKIFSCFDFFPRLPSNPHGTRP